MRRTIACGTFLALVVGVLAAGTSLSPDEDAVTAVAAPAVAAPALAQPAPRSSTVYVTHALSDVTPIDVATKTPGPRIPVGGSPFAIAITPDGATAYVTDQGSNSVTPIEVATNTPGPTIPVGETPLGIAITPGSATAYVTNQSSNSVTPIEVATNTPGPTIPVGDFPVGIAITPDGATAYVVNQISNSVTPIEVATNTRGPTIPVGVSPVGIAITPDGAVAYVTNQGSDSVTPIYVATNTPGPTIPVGRGPFGIAITADGTGAYVTNQLSDSVTPIEVATNTPYHPIPVGDFPTGIASAPDGTTYVASQGSNSVTLIEGLSSPGAIPVGEAPVGIAITPEPLGTVGTSRFLPMAAARILDTRVGVGAPLGKLAAGSVLQVPVAGTGGVPADATAVVFNLTATEADGAGFVTAWAAGSPRPNTSVLNVGADQDARANLVTVAIGAGGQVSLYTLSDTHVLGDIVGYYQPSPASASGRYTPVAPARLIDSRAGGAPRPPAGATVSVPVLGRGGMPSSGVAAVVVTVTVDDAAGRGFVTVYPGGTALPWASTVNAEYPGHTVANQTIVPVGADGSIDVYTQSGGHVIVDVVGWFSDASGSPSTVGLFRPVLAARVLDTRGQGARPGAGATVAVAAGVPAGARAAIVNLTGTEAAEAGFVTAWGTGTIPIASSLNLDRPGHTIAAHATVPLAADGSFQLYTHTGAHLIADITGWYQ